MLLMSWVESGITSLHRSARLGDYNISAALLASSTSSINDQTEYGYAALHLACAAGHTTIVELLVEGGSTAHIETACREDDTNNASISLWRETWREKHGCNTALLNQRHLKNYHDMPCVKK